MNLFDIANLEKELPELEKQTLEDGFWCDSKKSSIVLQKMKVIKNQIENYNKLQIELNNLIEMSELIIQENDESLSKDILKNTISVSDMLEKLEIQTLLSGKYDINNAIVTIHPGAGRNRITRLGRNVI